jgi:hypothetical protein
MATGFTYPVKEGKVTTLREFALQCARAFGANILMRYESMDAPIKAYEPDHYHRDELEKAKAALYDAERLTEAEAAKLAMKAFTEAMRCAEEINARYAIERVRYDSMLAKVREWKAPTADHEGMKRFMIEQLEGSIRFGCSPYESNVKLLSGAEYRAQLIERASRDIEYHAKGWEDEQRRTVERNEWNRALLESLK